VRKGVQKAVGQGEGRELEGDRRLAKLASWTMDHLGEGGKPPPHAIVEFFAHHLGLVEPTPHLLIRGQPDPGALESGVADSVSQFLAREPYNVYGAAVEERQGLMLVVVTLARRGLELRPVPRRLPEGQGIAVEGRVDSAYSNPRVVVAPPEGDVIRRSSQHDAEFDVTIPTKAPGQYGVEVLAKGPHGDTVLANFPVYVGVQVPRSVALESGDDASGARDASQVQQRLLQLLNRTRAENGVPPVRSHSGLRKVARAHSQDMVENDFVGHSSPNTGSASDRVRGAGFSSGLVLENIGRGYSAKEIHRGLLRSPGHRANIVNPDVTHVGIGVVAEQEGSRTAFVVTEVLVRMAQEIDVSRAPGRLLRKINVNRRRRGSAPLEQDENLQEAAQKAAERFFADPSLSQQDVVNDASASLRKFSIAFHRVGGVMAVVTSLTEAAQMEPTLNPAVRYAGIGVAQGSRPDTPSNGIAVVVMLAEPRED
jgi:uncharacterized protein YkwD